MKKMFDRFHYRCYHFAHTLRKTAHSNIDYHLCHISVYIQDNGLLDINRHRPKKTRIKAFL